MACSGGATPPGYAVTVAVAQQALFGASVEVAQPSLLVPPIKCQGIKTKLVPFIRETVAWTGKGRWIEPFAGSGVVAFSLRPERALLCDTNPHIIRLYSAIQTGELTPAAVRAFLEREGALLASQGESHYYEIRKRFNDSGGSLDFLFLNRSCFNGLMRFNRRGGFNVPFNRKPHRFAPAYVTKIVNQVAKVSAVFRQTDWELAVMDWRASVLKASEDDFIYADPPYTGRFTDYFNKWDDAETLMLVHQLMAAPCDFALSTWVQNRYRRNDLIDKLPATCSMATTSHFYHLGATEDLRNEVEEALIMRTPAHLGS